VGQWVAPGIGRPIGAALGRVAGALYSQIRGKGDYVVSNSLVGATVPSFGASAVTIRQREFLGFVEASTSFSISKYALNPGQSATFPWVSGMAGLYEEYRFGGLIFEFKTTSATAIGSTNTALGSVIMATDYDPANPPFADSRAMKVTLFANSAVPCVSSMHAIECSRSSGQNVSYVRTGPPLEGTDIRLYDWGNFYIATEGMQEACTIGELWVSYDIHFSKPVLQSGGGSIPTQIFTLAGMSGGTFAHVTSRGPPEGFFPVEFIEGGGISAIVLPSLDLGQHFEITFSASFGVLTGSLNPSYINCALVQVYEFDDTTGKYVVMIKGIAPTTPGVSPSVVFSGLSWENGTSGELLITRINDWSYVDTTPDQAVLAGDVKLVPSPEPLLFVPGQAKRVVVQGSKDLDYFRRLASHDSKVSVQPPRVATGDLPGSGGVVVPPPSGSREVAGLPLARKAVSK